MGLLNTAAAPFQAFLNALFSARVRVKGESMTPTLHDGQSVLVVRPVFPWNRLQRGDVVVLNPPGAPNPEDWFIKRIAGMPGEEIVLDGGRVYVDDLLLSAPRIPSVGPELAEGPDGQARREWWNGPDEYFVLGDNPTDSRDSRAFGPVPTDRIIGRVWLSCWPPKAWGRVR